jgi:hypothetical protein
LRWGVLAVGIAVGLFHYFPAVRAPFLALGCKLGVASGCFALSGIYEEAGKPERSLPLLRRGCEQLRQPKSCASYGMFIAMGWGTPANPAEAERLCMTGGDLYGELCFSLALDAEVRSGADGEGARIATLYRRACGAGVTRACGMATTIGARAPLWQQMNRDAEACARGDRDACGRVHDRLAPGRQ